jgi:hypothetical protein
MPQGNRVQHRINVERSRLREMIAENLEEPRHAFRDALVRLASKRLVDLAERQRQVDPRVRQSRI